MLTKLPYRYATTSELHIPPSEQLKGIFPLGDLSGLTPLAVAAISDAMQLLHINYLAKATPLPELTKTIDLESLINFKSTPSTHQQHI